MLCVYTRARVFVCVCVCENGDTASLQVVILLCS